jgi:hypothetical protein
MNETLEQRQLDSSVIDFVARHWEQYWKQVCDTTKIVNAYRDAHSDLIHASGATPEQLSAMIEYLFRVGLPLGPTPEYIRFKDLPLSFENLPPGFTEAVSDHLANWRARLRGQERSEA